jgi:hypothetical protein
MFRAPAWSHHWRPGGNITGLSNLFIDVAGRRVQLPTAPALTASESWTLHNLDSGIDLRKHLLVDERS